MAVPVTDRRVVSYRGELKVQGYTTATNLTNIGFDMTWISEEAEKELEKRRQEQEQLTRDLIKARERKRNPFVESIREVYIPVTSVQEMK